MGLVNQELQHLHRVRVHSPNIRAQWQAEEDDRALIEWCRKAPAGEPSSVEIPAGRCTPASAYSFFRSIIP